MSNYFSNKNNQNAEFSVTKDKVTLTVDHGNHTHSLDLTNITAEELLNNPGEALGNAHRNAAHDKK